jgi:RNA polymerase sigma factor (TIGR02999 family)
MQAGGMIELLDFAPAVRSHKLYNLSYLETVANTGCSETTRLLRAWADGDQQALEKLIPRVYDELRRMARRFMGHKEGTIQTTALVHEAYLRLVDVHNVSWEHRAQFFAISARVMRRILLDRARRKFAAKRGGAAVRLDLDEAANVTAGRAVEVIQLDEALKALAKFDPRKAQIIELRFFAGLSVEETSAVLKISQDTVMRDWRLARSWLLAELAK